MKMWQHEPSAVRRGTRNRGAYRICVSASAARLWLRQS